MGKITTNNGRDEMEHQHITPKHKDWGPHNYQCECGFKTRDRVEFDNHLDANKEETVMIDPGAVGCYR